MFFRELHFSFCYAFSHVSSECHEDKSTMNLILALKVIKIYNTICTNMQEDLLPNSKAWIN